jgi:hypothetical protein
MWVDEDFLSVQCVARGSENYEISRILPALPELDAYVYRNVDL